jgi:phage shock protein A
MNKITAKAKQALVDKIASDKQAAEDHVTALEEATTKLEAINDQLAKNWFGMGTHVNKLTREIQDVIDLIAPAEPA